MTLTKADLKRRAANRKLRETTPAEAAENYREKQDLSMNEDAPGYNEDTNPRFLFSTTNNNLVLRIATGELDAKDLAQKNLADQGLGRNGQWVGFDQAEKEWNIS